LPDFNTIRFAAKRISGMTNNPFPQPWSIVPELASAARRIKLPSRSLELHVYDSGGDLPPALLIHGLADEADTWRHVWPELCRTHRLIAMDLPGFGRSSKPAITYTPDVYVTALCELMDMLAIKSAAFVGSSMGAMISQVMAVLYPQRVQRLVLIDGTLTIVDRPTTLKGKLMAWLQTAPQLGEMWYTSLRKDPQKAYETLRAYYRDLDALQEADRKFLFRRVNERVWDDAQRAAFFSVRRNMPGWFKTHPHVIAGLAKIKAPMTLIWGTEDRVLSARNAHATLGLIKHAQLVELPGVGHLPQQDAPAKLLPHLHLALATVP
jgi:pimeloyl-ACP methyl ester carboxylesterase